VHWDDSLVEGDRLSLRFHMTGTHGGPFLGVPATGKPIDLTGQTILRFAGERCVERWSTADFLAVMMQIGAIPAPA